MLRISDILTPERTLCSIAVQSKKKAIELIAETIANSVLSLQPQPVFDALIARERLGSTVLGQGVAIPHARLEQTEQVLGCFILLKESIDFDAEDHIPVDMLFSFIVPYNATQEQTDVLAYIAKIFESAAFLESIRTATNAQELYQTLNCM